MRRRRAIRSRVATCQGLRRQHEKQQRRKGIAQDCIPDSIILTAYMLNNGAGMNVKGMHDIPQMHAVSREGTIDMAKLLPE